MPSAARGALLDVVTGIDPSCVGFQCAAIDYEYGWRDAVLYALSVGAGPRELDYLYEGRGPRVLPTFCTIPTFAAFDSLVDRLGCDRAGMIHHSQRIELHKPLQPNARLRVQGRVEGLYDLKRLAMSVFVIDAHDELGDLIIRGRVTLLLRNDGGFGGKPPPRSERLSAPGRDPDFEVHERIPPSQALLYRLNGDYNPLHADPEFAARAGFDQPIMHGLCTFGYAGRAVVSQACEGDAGALATLQAQFANPVYPGDCLVIRGWKDGGRVALTVTTEERPGRPCFVNAFATMR